MDAVMMAGLCRIMSAAPIPCTSRVPARMKERDAARQGEVLAPVNGMCPSGQIGLSMITKASSR
jgi:hypothetical protein